MISIFVFLFLVIMLLYILYIYYLTQYREGFVGAGYDSSYLSVLDKDRYEGHFPFRYTQDEKGNTLPLVMVSAFFRDNTERERFFEYKKHGIQIVGITAYKSFPKPITDPTGDSETPNDPFNYYKNIQHWFCCFNNPAYYGFGPHHQLVDISESDFYDAEETVRRDKDKKYDLVYVCLGDSDDHCPMDGWNAINRNFKLALACFPILIQELKLKILVIGREHCGLEKLYGDQITVMGFLPWHEFQEKLRQSRILFVPNIYDASPRVVAESLIKGLPVLMNRAIVCGSKYIVPETGELFTDENDIRWSVLQLLSRMPTMDTAAWWKQHYSRKTSGQKMRTAIEEWFPGFLPARVEEVYFK